MKQNMLAAAFIFCLVSVHIGGKMIEVEKDGKKYLIDENPYNIAPVKTQAGIEARTMLQGTRALMKFEFTAKTSVPIMGAQISEGVFHVVRKYPASESVEVWVFLLPDGLKNPDGTPMKQKMHMGIVRVENAAAVRKSPNVYKYMADTKAFYAEEVKKLNHSSYLPKY